MKKILTILLTLITTNVIGQAISSNYIFKNTVGIGWLDLSGTKAAIIRGSATNGSNYTLRMPTGLYGSVSILGDTSGAGHLALKPFTYFTSAALPNYGVQYDSSGKFSANYNLLYDYTNGRLGVGGQGTLPTQTFQVNAISKNNKNQNTLFTSTEAYNYIGVKSQSQHVTWGISDDITLYNSPFFVFNTANDKFPVMVSYANDGNGSMVIGAGPLTSHYAPAYFQNHTLELMPKGTDGAQLVLNSVAISGGAWAMTVNGTGSAYGDPNSLLLFNQTCFPAGSGNIAIFDSSGLALGRKKYQSTFTKANAVLHMRHYLPTDTLMIVQDSSANPLFYILPDGKTGVGTASPTSTFTINGSFGVDYVAKTANYTATASDYLINFTANADTLTLPTAVGITGRKYVAKVTGSSACVVRTTSSQTIDGSTTYGLTAQYKYVEVVSDGANWIIVANN